MRCPSSIVAVGFALAVCARAAAADFSFEGYADFRLVAPAAETNWLDGGLGKLRFGAGGHDPDLQFTEAVAQGVIALNDDWHVVAVGRFDPREQGYVDALEAYVAYRPNFENWSGSLKAGAFFPPFSLENTDLGWTSPYTLTPSAIDSWIGDELRTVGAEARVERHTAIGAFALTASAFCCNDPAGILIAERGWTLDDRPTGLFEEAREPDATLRYLGEPQPASVPLFQEIDNRIGWYAGASWSQAGIGKAELYRYDNEANAAAFSEDYHAWHTRFWSAGWESHVGPFSILAQGLSGDTTIVLLPGSTDETRFRSAYLLLSYDIGDWRLAARADTFQTRAAQSFLSETGDALTAALSWRPRDWLRVTAEIIDITSTRDERTLEQLDPKQSETQFQLSARFFI